MNFYKYEAAGNDFVILDARKEKADWNKLALDMCRRHFGVGADGIITVDIQGGDNLFMRIFNADGSEAEVCGNGLRCFAKFVADEGISSSDELKIFTPSGIKLASVYKDNGKVNRVRVNMGMPKFKAEEIPVRTGDKSEKQLYIKDILNYSLKVGRTVVDLNFVSMGNPHAVAFISMPVDEYDMGAIGPKIEHNAIFPRKTNFEIANVINKKTIKVRVWERGVGETLACGSGACATGVAAINRDLVDNDVDIIMPGGKLEISWRQGEDVYLTGPVKRVFQGEWLRNIDK
jgi:diaminopimelate epimerase